MTTVEFGAVIKADRTLDIPEALVDRLPIGRAVRVVVLLADEENDHVWEEATARSFGLGYAESDAIYDQLSSR